MIEKMKFLSITGHKGDIDQVVDQYFSRYEIHLENALSELKTVPDLRPFNESNPYKGEYQTANQLIASHLNQDRKETPLTLSIEEAVQLVRSLDQELKVLSEEKESKEKELDMDGI